MHKYLKAFVAGICLRNLTALISHWSPCMKECLIRWSFVFRSCACLHPSQWWISALQIPVVTRSQSFKVQSNYSFIITTSSTFANKDTFNEETSEMSQAVVGVTIALITKNLVRAFCSASLCLCYSYSQCPLLSSQLCSSPHSSSPNMISVLLFTFSSASHILSVFQNKCFNNT